MAFAHVGVLVEYFTCEIPKAQDVFTLCGNDRNLVILEILFLLEFDNTIALHDFLQLQECTGIRKLAFSAVLNNRPA